jgi:multidrug efflux pump subunit AcrA (membrane-fusion protein)
VALVQQGHSLQDVADLHRTGFLDPVVRVPVPAGAPAWEVREVLVRPGEKIEAGAVLVLLADPRRVALEVEAPGADAALVEKAIRDGATLEARPLVEGAGPVLRGVRLAAFRPAGEGAASTRAYAVVENEEILRSMGDGPRMAAWRLRAGMRYVLRFPVRAFPESFVLPREAVATEGSERVVFLRSGQGFRRQPVHVVHEEREAAVIADDGALFPGDPVVVSGAFALSLALRASDPASTPKGHAHGPT